MMTKNNKKVKQMELTKEALEQRLKVANIQEIAKHSDIHFNTLYRLRGGIGRPPSKATLRKLSDFYLKLEAGEIKL